MNLFQKTTIGCIGLSFSYGFYRTWTLPIWNHTNESVSGKNPLLKTTIRTGFSFINGMAYMIPPIVLVKSIHLYQRMQEHNECNERKGIHWEEFGFVQPRVF